MYFCSIKQKHPMTTLDKLEIGQSARIKAVGGEGQRRQHFLDMGLIPDAVIKIVKYAPLGDPMEVMIHGYALTLRKADAALIETEPCDDTQIEADTKNFNPDRLYTTTRHTKPRYPKVPNSLSPSPDNRTVARPRSSTN